MVKAYNFAFLTALVENAVKFCKHMNKMQAKFLQNIEKSGTLHEKFCKNFNASWKILKNVPASSLRLMLFQFFSKLHANNF